MRAGIDSISLMFDALIDSCLDKNFMFYQFHNHVDTDSLILTSKSSHNLI